MKKAIFFLFIFTVGSVLWAQQRYALVIGNNNYTSVRRLDNPVNDATDIAGKLRNLDYQVDLQTNVTNVAMARSITDFINRLSQNRNNEGFFWFAGHAVQINGENYLLPIDVNSTNEVEAVHSSYAVKRLVDSLDKIARNKVNVVVLDACRNNPFVNMPGSFRSVSRGLSVVQNLPSDLLIIYSTAPDNEAQDGQGQRNSPFAQAFLQNMDSNEDIQIVFRTIARETMRLTNNNQRPFNDGSIISLDYYSLNPRRTPPAPGPSPTPESTYGNRPIMGPAFLTKNAITSYVTTQNPNVDRGFLSSLIDCYFAEARMEGISHDIAIAQMLFCTDFLRIQERVRTHNYAGLSAVGLNWDGSFPDMLTGVRAHIQHLQGYASRQPLNTELVDPKYHMIREFGRMASTFGELLTIWHPSNVYRDSIYDILDQLYKF